MPVSLTLAEFDRLVDHALDSIPRELSAMVDNCLVVVEPDSPEGEPEMLGLYEGIPLTERDTAYSAVMPDRIFIFMNPILAMCETEQEVVAEVHITVVHEIAHHFGIEDDRLHELGYG